MGGGGWRHRDKEGMSGRTDGENQMKRYGRDQEMGRKRARGGQISGTERERGRGTED